MSFNKTTTVTNTGLGDDQYEQLQTNQEGLGTQSQEGFTAVGEGLTGLGTKIEGATTGINANTNTGFNDLTGVVKGYGDTLTQGQTDAATGRAKYYNDMLTALQNNTGGLATQASLDTGFQDANIRFDTLDTNVGGVQSAVDTGFADASTQMTEGFSDAGSRFDSLDTNVGGVQSAVDAGFDSANTSLNNLGADLNTAQTTITGNQGTLQDSVNTMSGNQDAYASSSLANQAALQSGQDTFSSNFDSFVDRYGQDAELATTARSDLATAQANQTDRLREDLGEYAQATATGQGNIAQTIGTLGTGIDAGFKNVGAAIGTGFSESSLADQTASENLSTRLGNVRDLIQTSSDTLEASTQDQYIKLANSFDENGQLIANSIDEQGNTISRSMDDQGVIMERKIDANGKELSAVSMDVETMLGNAEAYEQSLMGQLDRRFDSAETSTGVQLQAIARGFTQQDKKLDSQTRDLAGLAAEQTDLDSNMRNEFRQLGQAFDDQGNLIQNSVMENGTTVSRAIDNSGNLMLRSFDAQGNRMGDQVMNINRSLNNLAQLSTIQGGNTSMGNLSPAMSNAAPSTGFASPYATTR